MQQGYGKTLGVVGGGQLGRMTAFAAQRLGFNVVILDPQPGCPAGQVANAQIVGELRDRKALHQLAEQSDVLTIEIEHVDAETLAELAAQGKPIYPTPTVIRLIQDKLRQKEALAAVGLPVAPFQAGARPGLYPAVLKARYNAYDGRGNVTVYDQNQLPEAIAQLGGHAEALYSESLIPFEREVAVMVARGQDGSIRSFPPVQTYHRDHILHVVIAPAEDAAEAVLLAEKAVAALDSPGIFGVELFGLADGTFLINEIAPRPHNAGHFTIEACATNQFEQHVRAVMGLPLGAPSMVAPAAVMINMLGGTEGHSEPDYRVAVQTPYASVHWYGKAELKPRRKMGHVTFTGSSVQEAVGRAQTLVPIDYQPPRRIAVGIIMGSDSDLPTMRQASEVLSELGIDHELTIVSAHRTPDRMYDYAHGAAARGLQVIIAGAGGAAHLPGMVAAMTTLPVIGVPIRTEALSGVDSLYSIVQMPRGIPVATVAIGNAVNAGLLAARILGSTNLTIRTRLDAYQTTMTEATLEKAHALEAQFQIDTQKSDRG